MTTLTILSTLAAALLAAGCAQLPLPSGAPGATTTRPPLQLTVLHTNDHHGRFWPNADGEYGLAARKTLVERIRAEVAAAGGHTLLLDGGDVNTGVPESDLQDAEPDFLGMNTLGYDAMAVGNHEFDKPPAVLARQRGWAAFPLLSANIYRADGQRLFEPYKLFDKAGYKIAVIGLTTDDTPRMVFPDHIAGLRFRAPADEAAQLVPQLRGQVDMVIAATHMGHYPDGRRGLQAPGDVELARAVPGIDLVVGGHSQNPVCMVAENQRDDAYRPGAPCAPDQQNGAWIVQAHEWGKYVGRADFTVDAGQVRLLRYQLLPVNLKPRGPDGQRRLAGETIAEDPALRALLQPFHEAGQARLQMPVGLADAGFEEDRTVVRQRATALGVLIARSMMARTGADLALMNGGGIRTGLAAGTISYRDVLMVQPFANTVVVVTLTGAELLDYLNAAAKMPPGSGGFPHTAGLDWRIEAGVVVAARVAGLAVDPGRRYQLALNNFVAAGGDGYPRLAGHSGYVDSGFNDAEVLRDYIARHSPLQAADYEPGASVQRR
jgi:5'-nucleotidase/UDP-sugar diphosphatase